jgi:hypothetical protein
MRPRHRRIPVEAGTPPNCQRSAGCNDKTGLRIPRGKGQKGRGARGEGRGARGEGRGARGEGRGARIVVLSRPEEAHEKRACSFGNARADEGSPNARIGLAAAGETSRWRDPAILRSFGRAHRLGEKTLFSAALPSNEPWGHFVDKHAPPHRRSATGPAQPVPTRSTVLRRLRMTTARPSSLVPCRCFSLAPGPWPLATASSPSRYPAPRPNA